MPPSPHGERKGLIHPAFEVVHVGFSRMENKGWEKGGEKNLIPCEPTWASCVYVIERRKNAAKPNKPLQPTTILRNRITMTLWHTSYDLRHTAGSQAAVMSGTAAAAVAKSLRLEAEAGLAAASLSEGLGHSDLLDSSG
jgi:hypothetical protein